MVCNPSSRPKQQCIICMDFQINVNKSMFLWKILFAMIFLVLCFLLICFIYCSRFEKKKKKQQQEQQQEQQQQLPISWYIRNWDMSLSSVLRKMFIQSGSGKLGCWQAHRSLHAFIQLTALGSSFTNIYCNDFSTLPPFFGFSQRV